MSAPVQSMPEINPQASQVVPALMLAVIVALTGFESVLIFAAPGKVAAHPVAHRLQLAARR